MEELIICIEEDICILLNKEHSLKEQYPIEVTEFGIAISSNDEQPEKALFPIFSNDEFSSNTTCFNEVQSSNALLSIKVTVDGIFISIKDMQSMNADLPINVTEKELLMM